MLAAALQAEVDAYIDAHAREVDADGRRLVVRNGYHQSREVLTVAGAVEVTAPRVNDRRVDPVSGERLRFSSAILRPGRRALDPIESLFATVRLRTKATKGPGARAAGITMAYKLIEPHRPAEPGESTDTVVA